MYKILIIEDNEELVEALEDLLQVEGFKTDHYYSVDSIEDYMILEKYDLILLDIMLPGTDGYKFLEIVRDEITRPIVFLSARNRSEDIIKGLNLGADDYITKPFEADVLIAKINSLLRRKISSRHTIINFGPISLNKNLKLVKVNDVPVDFTATEFDILYLLAENPGVTFSKEDIKSKIYSLSYDTEDRIVSQYIYQIRRKFEGHKIDPIKSKWGVGYRWEI